MISKYHNLEMKPLLKLLAAVTFFVLLDQSSAAQASTFVPGARVNPGGNNTPPSRGWTDPALDHNKLIQNNGTYQLVGGYKVKGSQFLLGQQLGGDIFSVAETAYNIFLSYNTYNQELEFYSSGNRTTALVKAPGSLDSFILHADTSMGILKPLKFVYGLLLKSNTKAYYQVVHEGERFGLYKKYRSELGFDADNYSQPDLRQFDLTYDYYYFDKQNNTLKKLKPNASAVIKEFRDIRDLSAVIDDKSVSNNAELALEKVFYYLNDAKKAF